MLHCPATLREGRESFRPSVLFSEVGVFLLSMNDNLISSSEGFPKIKFLDTSKRVHNPPTLLCFEANLTKKPHNELMLC